MTPSAPCGDALGLAVLLADRKSHSYNCEEPTGFKNSPLIRWRLARLWVSASLLTTTDLLHVAVSSFFHRGSHTFPALCAPTVRTHTHTQCFRFLSPPPRPRGKPSPPRRRAKLPHRLAADGQTCVRKPNPPNDISPHSAAEAITELNRVGGRGDDGRLHIGVGNGAPFDSEPHSLALQPGDHQADDALLRQRHIASTPARRIGIKATETSDPLRVA